MSAKSTLLHRIDHRLEVAGAERDVVGIGRGRVGVQGDGGCAGGLRRPQRGALELQERLDVEVFARVVLQCLVDDRGDLVLGQREQLARIGTLVLCLGSLSEASHAFT